MSFRINTNLSAMNALRSLGSTATEMAKASNRLSTGMRINSGADDPSGLIASESYRAQIKGMDAALRNNQDALNYAKTAEGGLDETARLLNEARSLAIANGNSTLDAAQKQANQTQLNNILSSIDRVSSNTQFGSLKLLNGSAGTNASVIAGATFSKASFGGNFGTGSISSNGTAQVQVTTVAETANVTGTITYTAATSAVNAGTFSLNGRTFTVGAGATRDSVLAQINAASEETGVTASLSGNAFRFDSVAYGSSARVDLVDTNGLFAAAGASSDTGVNAVASVTLSGQTVTFNQGNGLELRDTNGNSITLTAAGNVAATTANAVRVNAGASTFQIGGNAGQTASLSLGNFSASSLGVSGLNITGTDMSSAINAIDSAITTVSTARGNIGSFMRNTIESNVRSLGVAKENLMATDSAIRDIDVAQEMTNFTRLQILQSSGMSVLAQANSAPQAVLQLLR
jgi:flagellin